MRIFLIHMFDYRHKLQIKKIGYWTPINFVVLVIREYTRYVVYVRNILVYCVGTRSQIFDVITVIDTSTCLLFCVVRKTIRPDIILKNTTHIKKLKYSPILTKSYYILSVFVLWNRCKGIYFTAYRDLLQY